MFIAVAGIGVVRRIWSHRREIFDTNFTDQDRALVQQTAFYVLLPVSVALHELGHAVMVWAFGAEVIDFGFYIFAGFVSYQGFITDSQAILIAAAGSAVNLLLAGAALGFVLLRRPPMRAAYNELLVQFAILSSANALIFYPALDLLTGMNGDFRQMYFGGVPWLSAVIGLVHGGVLAGGYFASKNERFSRHLGELTGLPPHVRRGLLGGLRLAPGYAQPTAQATESTLSADETTMLNAVKRVGAGWPEPLAATLVRQASSASIVVSWGREPEARATSVVLEPAGSVTTVVPPRGATKPPRALQGTVWQRWAEMPSEDQLVLGIRVAMEEAERRWLPKNGRAVSEHD